MKGVEQIEHTLHNLASPKRGHTFWGLVLILVLASLLIWLKHASWLATPNDFMLGEGDGFKNYMTTAWHVRYDSSYVHYGGMNYPFGEHVLFTDNQPMVSAGMQWWNRHVFDIGNSTVGIVNVFQVLSIIFGAGILYILLRKLHLPVWYAIAASLGIAFLSPQYNRFDGHFGLSHIWVLPWILLLLCRYEERQSRRYQSLLIGILIWFSAQLHFYNLGVAALFLGFYTVFQILLDLSWRNIWTRMSHLTVMILLPFALLNVWLHWSDYCKDRPANPYGFTDYIGRWEGVFLPYQYFPMHQWINTHLVKIRDLDFEAQSYVGLVAFLFTLWLIFKRRFRLFEPEWEHAAYHRVHKNYLRGICFAGFAILMFSLGFPFSFKGMEWMVDYFGPIRQFRGLGRFSWAFYYAIHVLIFYIIWNKSQRLQLKETWINWVKTRSATLAQHLPNLAKWSLAILPLIVLSWEAYYFQAHKPLKILPNFAQRSAIVNGPNHWLNKVDFGRYQALMPLPYYHIGSENIWLSPWYPLFQKVQSTAVQTGVPDMGVNMSRSAVSRMVKSLQFAFPASEPPVLLAELPDNRPIALMIEPEKWAEVQDHYGHLLEYAKPVYEGPELKIMALIPDSVRVWSQKKAKKVAQEMDRNGNYDVGAGFKSNQSSVWFRHENFDANTASEHVFQGKGAGEARLSDTTMLFNAPIPKGQYEFSIWIKVDEDMGMTQSVKFLEKNRADNRAVFFQKSDLRFELRSIVQGWALFVQAFEVKEDNSMMEIYLQKPNAQQHFWYDELLIKNAGPNLYKRSPGWVIQDNNWFKLPKNGTD